MAYFAALSSPMELLEDIILGERYPNFLLGRHPAMNSLLEKVSFLAELLQDYSSKGGEANDRVERRIRDVANWAQDIIELEISNQISSEEILIKNTVRKMFSACKFFLFNKRVQMVQQEIDVVAGKMIAIKERQRIEGFRLNSDSPDHGTSTSERATAGNMMVGFDTCLTTIKDKLCGQSSQLQVISLVGMGGIGKTTLARNTFEDALIVYRFDFRIWVTISQDYDVNNILQTIRKSMGLKDNESLEGTEESLEERIRKHLKGKRYFIVLDDVWSTKVWDHVRPMFPNDNNGSRIMLTTRLSDVAHHAGTSGFLHQMQFLNDDQSWKLFKEKVFAEECCSLELERTGKLIASKCGGLPLAIVVIAGVLSKVKTPHYWKKIANDVSVAWSRTDEHLSSILSLSYNHLPHQLKGCFLYMGRFQEDYQIDISKLIRLWIAEGFLKSANESQSLEDVAKDCFEDLVKRNLVITTGKRANGEFKFCVLHDVLRDFCRERAFSEGFFHVVHKKGYLHSKGVEDVRRVNWDCKHPNPLRLKKTGKLVRSVLSFGQPHQRNCRNIGLNGCKLLRVLDAPDMLASSIPADCFKMFHLKYLSLYLYHNDLRFYLPPSILMLCNLQTLVIYNIKVYPIVLPDGIWKMTRLRHLIMSVMVLPPVPTTSDDFPVQKLEHLQTLTTPLDFRFTSEAIGMIPIIRNLKLTCTDESNVRWESYGLDNLVHLPYLEELKIIFHSFVGPPHVNFPHSFTFPRNLKKLSLHGCRLPWNDMRAVGSLPNLQVLRLRKDAFVGEEWEPIEGEFQSLKFLLLSRLHLSYWGAEKYHFPCLEHLKIRMCLHFFEFPLEIGDIPTLKFIDVYKSEGILRSVNLIQEEQRNMGNDVLQVRIGHW